MIEIDGDIAILGAGFGGSLMALIVQRIGLRPVLIDRSSHPRFAIGESSTPIANLVLSDLADMYELPRIAPLAKYGAARRAYPDIVLGRKRGFSYFKHEPDSMFQPRHDHANELLVAASDNDEQADTHWLRSDVDRFFADEAQAAGIAYLDGTNLTELRRQKDWSLRGTRGGEDVLVRVKFAIDASGEAGVLLRVVGARDESHRLATRSRSLFGHFADVTPWQDYLRLHGGAVDDHPFHCDDAALHHLLDGAWMWQLRFCNGVTSAGIVLDERIHGTAKPTSASRTWDQWLGACPSMARQFDSARLVAPAAGLQATSRLQRLADNAAGDNWAALPNSVAFVDPLHSTGIAQTLCGVRRLAHVLEHSWNCDRFNEELARYSDTVRNEVLFVDRLVHGCYRTMRDFGLFATYSMLYFAAATSFEHRYLQRRVAPQQAFLCADDKNLCDAVNRIYRQTEGINEAAGIASDVVRQFQRDVAAAIAPFNIAGLCDPQVHNMYRYTAVPV